MATGVQSVPSIFTGVTGVIGVIGVPVITGFQGHYTGRGRDCSHSVVV